MQHQPRSYFDRPATFEPERLAVMLILAAIAQLFPWGLLCDQSTRWQPSLTLRLMGGLPMQLAPL